MLYIGYGPSCLVDLPRSSWLAAQPLRRGRPAVPDLGRTLRVLIAAVLCVSYLLCCGWVLTPPCPVLPHDNMLALGLGQREDCRDVTEVTKPILHVLGWSRGESTGVQLVIIVVLCLADRVTLKTATLGPYRFRIAFCHGEHRVPSLFAYELYDETPAHCFAAAVLGAASAAMCACLCL